MTDIHSFLATFRRPRLLVRAARFGLTDYNRNRDLKRLIHDAVTPVPRIAFGRLVEEEAALEDARKSGGAGYSPARHVEVMIALIAEAQALLRAGREPEIS